MIGASAGQVITGVPEGGFTVNVMPLEVPPPGVGLKTVIVAGPLEEMSPAGTRAVS